MLATIKPVVKAILPPIVTDAVQKLRRRRRLAVDSDAVVTVTVRGVALAMTASHDLPELVSKYPHYDTALPRIAAFVKKTHGYLSMIDVGANIGDSVALVVAKAGGGDFLCIEGEARFLDLLRHNLAAMAGVTVEYAIVSDGLPSMAVRIETRDGSGKVVTADSKWWGNVATTQTVPVTTVDDLVARHPRFARTNLLKIDTDGWDYKVLCGSDQLIRTAQPLIHCELSPEHLRIFGHDDAMDVFSFLRERGYPSVLIYEGLGLPMAHLKTDDQNALASLMHYARLKDSFWYDIVTAPASMGVVFEALVNQEMHSLPLIPWVQGP